MQSRLIRAGLGLLVLFGGMAAHAASVPDFVIYGQSVDTVPMTGHEMKSFEFPIGTIKVLIFKAGNAASHKITNETQLFVASGAAEVEVDGKRIEVAAGDAVNRPVGEIRVRGAEETVIVAHIVGSTVRDSKPLVVRGATLPEALSAQWMERDTPIRVTTPEQIKKAPESAGRLAVKRYEFDGNSIRLVSLAGGATNVSTYGSDNILLIIKGRLRRHVDGAVAEVRAGDAVREISGTSGYWEILEDATFISTSALPL